ncbi:ROK family transcriptional regulator [Aquibacillus saliphilus]|uniref:ROK family transcriptional regulator n=1 Tax=Aquibacillus saliphilus TaxID=1909422 RepID=UPI001CEFB411|nr:ROK family transcriptional regulator [Aquibacillus saliphilus]
MHIKNQETLKKENQSLVLELILSESPISRAEIAKRTKMSPTSASRIVASLKELGLIREVSLSSDGLGRKALYFIPDEMSVISIGAEITPHDVHIGFVGFKGKLIVKETVKYSDNDPHAMANLLYQTVEDMIHSNGLGNKKIVGMCVGLPGLIEHKVGNVRLSAQFDWHDVPLAKIFSEKFGFGISIDNALKLRAFAEYNLDEELVNKNMAMIGFGTGVGSALVFDGEIYRGENNFSGEIGHSIVDPYGIACTCGNIGCLQTYISERFLLDEASKCSDITTMDELVEAYLGEEKWAVNILNKAITYAAITINNVICVNNPNAVVLSGKFIVNYSVIREKIIAKYQELLWSPIENTFDLKVTRLGSEGTILGAALSVQRYFVKNLDV